MAEGWTAGTRADEPPGGPTAKVFVVESITDVTADIAAVVNDPDIADEARVDAVDRRKSELAGRVVSCGCSSRTGAGRGSMRSCSARSAPRADLARVTRARTPGVP